MDSSPIPSLGNIFEDGLIQNLLKGPKISLKCEPILLDHASQSRETICCLSNFFLSHLQQLAPRGFSLQLSFILHIAAAFSRGDFLVSSLGLGVLDPTEGM